jgi:uncharacterized protein
MAVQISLYLNEGDEYRGRPLHLEVLNYLRAENVAGATVLHAVAGFTGRSRVKTSALVDAGGKLPLILTFIDADEHVTRVLPRLREMAGQRLIVRQEVGVEQGPFD